MPKKKKKDKGKKKGKGGDGGASEKEEKKDFEVPGSSEKEVELKRECVMIVCKSVPLSFIVCVLCDAVQT